jgi:predicted membrane channel-forming protein YqfA (hemolysin III family)
MNNFFKVSALIWLPFLFLLLYLSSEIANVLEYLLTAYFLLSWTIGVFGIILLIVNWQRFKSILFPIIFLLFMPFVVVHYFLSQLH